MNRCTYCNNRGEISRKKYTNERNIKTQVKSHDTEENQKTTNYENKIINELLSQLSLLKGELEVGKTEYADLQMKYNTIQQISNNEKNDLAENVDKLKREVQFKQLEKVHLTSSYLEEQKKYLEQIGKLKNSLVNTLAEKDKVINDLQQTKTGIDNKLKAASVEIKEIHQNTVKLKHKSFNYKNKLKAATNCIKQIINELETTSDDKKDQGTQTLNTSIQSEETKLNVNSIQHPNCDESEYVLLSELFFKELPLSDSIGTLFINQNCPSKTHLDF